VSSAKRYVNCIDGQEQAANDRIAKALRMVVNNPSWFTIMDLRRV